MVCGFVAGPALCLIADLNDNYYSSGSASTVTDTAHVRVISVIPRERQLDLNCLPLVSSLTMDQNTFYDGVRRGL